MQGTPRKRARTRLEVDARRAQLLALGIRIFSEQPYDEVSIDDLARAARVSKGLLYHYFQNKRDFYVAAVGQASEQLLAETMTPEDAAPEERMRLGLETYVSFAERHGHAYVALMRGGIGADPEVSAILERTRGTFVARILEGVPRRLATPVVRMTVRGWIGFVEATLAEWVSRHDVPRKKLVALLGAVLLHSLEVASGQPLLPARAPSRAAPLVGRVRRVV